MAMIPRQMKDEEEVEKVESTGTAAEEGSSSLMSSNACVNVLLARSMEPLWAMMESL